MPPPPTGNNAQNLGNLLGKILRIDIDAGPPYGIPATNPFVGVAGARAEIWAYGLRNPWRFTFDRLTGDLFIGDVGQNAWEEIDFQPAVGPGGENYGWRRMEGTHCFNPPTGCDDGTLTHPIIEYPHAGVHGNAPDCSVTGGYRYRGASIPELAGHYLFADLCSGRLLGAALVGSSWRVRQLLDTPYEITTFGEDEMGELYIARYDGDGAVYRIVAPAPRARRLHDFNGDGPGDILWRNVSGLVDVWLTDGAGGILERGPVGTVSNDWTIQSVGDFDGDRKDDILWRHASGLLAIWFMDGVRIASSAPVTSAGSDWTIEAVGDFDGDGKADILWRHVSGVVHLWFMTGPSIAQQGSPGSAPSQWRIEDVGDFNGDGRADILWRHASGATSVWLLNGAVIEGAGSPGAPSIDWTIQRVHDFDGDGRADILWRHSSGVTSIWLLDGMQIAGFGVPGNASPLWTIEAVGPGTTAAGGDLLWRHTSGLLHRWAVQGTTVVGQANLEPVSTEWIIY